MIKTVHRPDTLPPERPASITYYEGFDTAAHDKALQLIDYAAGTEDVIKYKKTYLFKTAFMSIDTETTSLAPGTDINPLPEQWLSFVYLYQVRMLGANFVFRTDEDFASFIQCCSDRLEKRGIMMIAYVHNLSFEWQFLKTRLDNIDRESVFALQSRRIAKFRTGNIEWRDSYLLSNMSLEKFAENYADQSAQKDKELIDYEVPRFPWSDLEPETLYYSLMDVISLEASVTALMEREQDTLKTIPMTNTGYVRRSCRLACLGGQTKKYRTPEEKKEYQKFYLYRHMFLKTQLSVEQYNILCAAFRGGNTHANRFLSGKILPFPEDEQEIGHADFASSYPAQLICSGEFPMGRLMECAGSLQTIADIDYYCKKYWVVIKAVFVDAELKNPYATKCPYIPLAKAKRETNKTGIYDNGRVISQPGGMVYAFLGIEWPIIKAQYSAKIKVIEAYYCPKGYLPLQLRQTCFEWYKKKTELKGVEGSEYEYMKSKNRVNSVYGMMVEHIVKDILTVNDDLTITGRKAEPDEALEQLERFYSPMQQKFLAFQWGVTITALARAEHMRLVKICGDDFIYGDTDSVFYLNPSKHAAEIEQYNTIWKQYITSCGCEYSARTKKGSLQILGVADQEPGIKRFITYGAKKYALETDKGIEITVAGVPKKAGAALLGKLENFKPGFVFLVGDDADADARRNWKKTLHYHDESDLTLQIDGHALRIRSGIALSRAPYELDITDEYALLTGYKEIVVEDDVFE